MMSDACNTKAISEADNNEVEELHLSGPSSTMCDHDNDHEHEQDLPVCTICQFEIEQNKMELDCGHMYHPECYNEYFAYEIMNKKTTVNCPVCRTLLIEVVVDGGEIIPIDIERDDVCCTWRWPQIRRTIMLITNLALLSLCIYIIISATICSRGGHGLMCP